MIRLDVILARPSWSWVYDCNRTSGFSWCTWWRGSANLAAAVLVCMAWGCTMMVSFLGRISERAVLAHFAHRGRLSRKGQHRCGAPHAILHTLGPSISTILAAGRGEGLLMDTVLWDQAVLLRLFLGCLRVSTSCSSFRKSPSVLGTATVTVTTSR